MCKNLKELMVKFADENVCRQYLINQRWGGVPVCPHCGCDRSYNIEGGRRIKCANNKCYKKYSVTIGTVMEATNIPLSTWLPAMYIISAHKKGISSIQLGKDLGVTQKTAWFMLHRIREALKAKNSPLLTGTVELDETYMSRKYASDFKGISPEKAQRFINKRGVIKRGAVVGVKERGGNVVVKAFDRATADAVKDAVDTHVSPDAKLMTDDAGIYHVALNGRNRKVVVHSAKQWVVGDVHTNGIENFWSVMKRGVYGIYHQISYKHLQAYCDEFTFRFNSRTLADGARFDIACSKIEGKLTYKQLVYGKNSKESSETKA